MIECLGHKFDTIPVSASDIAPAYRCIRCKCAAYSYTNHETYSNMQLFIIDEENFRPDNKLIISCDEFIIKNIIE